MLSEMNEKGGRSPTLIGPTGGRDEPGLATVNVPVRVRSQTEDLAIDIIVSRRTLIVGYMRDWKR